MTTETPNTGAKRSSKNRIITILIFLFLSSGYVFWREAPVIRVHNISAENLLYIVKVDGKDTVVGQINPNAKYTIDLPFWQARSALVTFQATANNKIIRFSSRTSWLGGLDFYIDPMLNISMEEAPAGFYSEKTETDEVIIEPQP